MRVGVPPALSSRLLDVGHKLNDRVRAESVDIAKSASLTVIERNQSVGGQRQWCVMKAFGNCIRHLLIQWEADLPRCEAIGHATGDVLDLTCVYRSSDDLSRVPIPLRILKARSSC